MKLKLISALTLGLAVAGTACSTKNQPQAQEGRSPAPQVEMPAPSQPAVTVPTTPVAEPAPAPAPVPAPAIPALKYVKTCNAELADQSCAGRYGFTVFADQTWMVGPGPQGQNRKGKLTDEEFQSINQAFTTAELFAITQFEAPACEKEVWTGRIGYDANITIQRDGQDPKVLARTENQIDICFAPATFKDLQAALGFEDALYLLVNKHAEDFPNDALEASNQLDQLYSDLRSCEADAECAYINENFQVAQVDEYVGCSAVTPLFVANAKKVVESLDKLLSLRNTAIAGGAITRCSDDGFTVQLNKPASCDKTAKKCTVHSEPALF